MPSLPRPGLIFNMVKRSRSISSASTNGTKKQRVSTQFNPRKVAVMENAQRVDKLPPMNILEDAVKERIINPEKGDCVVYWMRMQDLRGGPVYASQMISFNESQYTITELYQERLRRPRRKVSLSSCFTSSVPRIMLRTIEEVEGLTSHCATCAIYRFVTRRVSIQD
jgi:hypothetical protein